MKTAVIMRGVPGGGKTTMAKIIAGAIGVIHSTDDYFYKDGVYQRDERKLAEYHQKNFDAFCESLRQGIPMVICDNVNHRYSGFSHYAHAARRAGYIVSVMSMEHPYPPEAAKRNIHGVSEEQIRRLIEAWEP